MGQWFKWTVAPNDSNYRVWLLPSRPCIVFIQGSPHSAGPRGSKMQSQLGDGWSCPCIRGWLLAAGVHPLAHIWQRRGAPCIQSGPACSCQTEGVSCICGKWSNCCRTHQNSKLPSCYHYSLLCSCTGNNKIPLGLTFYFSLFLFSSYECAILCQRRSSLWLRDQKTLLKLLFLIYHPLKARGHQVCIIFVSHF